MDRQSEITTGGCQCGAIRYRFHGKTINPSICHCRMCQKAFGSYFAPLGGVKRDNLEWTRGALSLFKSSTVAERGFCAACGTPLTFAYIESDEINIALGSLDHPEREIPVNAYGSESEMPWFDWLAGLPAHATDPSLDKVGSLKNFQHPDHDTD
ncbi:MAG: GFA family protein [Alphaproteobacteria bacterium]